MYIEFEKWLNNILEENMPIPGAAINFNLYEEADLYWSIQLICASYFDEADEDWCCEENRDGMGRDIRYFLSNDKTVYF